ncbi:MAG: helix-turn-helix transcriptional regulator [Clostridia bacterium]|nr:helix-turn-helix transcriptional regulator [Clostridia bacterium]
MEAFGQRLKQLRKSKKLTQQELADLLGISKVAISEYETGKVNPSPEHLIRIANIFNVSIDYFYGKLLKLSRQEYILNVRTPVLSRIPADIGDSTQLDVLYYRELDKKYKKDYSKYFIFKENENLFLVHIQWFAEDGDRILACINGEDARIFDCVYSDNVLVLTLNNNIYPIDENVCIVGKVIV